MNSLGGYFELELQNGKEYHKDAIRLNTGRNALELILSSKQFQKVYVPFYTCGVVMEPIYKLQIDFEFYSIDENMEPLFNFNNILEREGFLYTNYFGLKDSYISNLSGRCTNLIIDNSQAFYAIPLPGIPTFYSCRKFFGVPDGAYLYLDEITELNFPTEFSSDRFVHLIKRIESGAEAGYYDFKENEHSLIGLPILQMSILTKRLLSNIDYELIQTKRRENFLFLHEHLSKHNELNIKLDEGSVPMVYSFLSKNSEFKQKLIENKIFVPTYWPNVLEWSKKESIEYNYASSIIHLPIDQRYSKHEMNFIIKLIKTSNEKMD